MVQLNAIVSFFEVIIVFGLFGFDLVGSEDCKTFCSKFGFFSPFNLSSCAIERTRELRHARITLCASQPRWSLCPLEAFQIENCHSPESHPTWDNVHGAYLSLAIMDSQQLICAMVLVFNKDMSKYMCLSFKGKVPLLAILNVCSLTQLIYTFQELLNISTLKDCFGISNMI